MTNNIILQFLNSPLQVLVVAQTVSARQSRLAKTASVSTPASSVPVVRTRTAMSQIILRNASMVSDINLICYAALLFSPFRLELFTQPCTLLVIEIHFQDNITTNDVAAIKSRLVGCNITNTTNKWNTEMWWNTQIHKWTISIQRV